MKYKNKKIMRLAGKILGILLFLGLLGFLALQLFFPKQYLSLESGVRQYFFPSAPEDAVAVSRPLFIAGFSSDASSLEPTSLDINVRRRTLQIYEPLVRFDRFFRIEPALARSFGRVSDTEWEFTLRENVFFHHGRFLTPDDVLASFDRAVQFSHSALKDYFHGLRMVVTSDSRIRVLTDRPDPLLLEKLTLLLILPREFAQQNSFPPMGTGAYRFVSWEKGKEMTFRRFGEYWSQKPVFERAVFQIFASQQDVLTEFIANEIDFIPSISPQNAKKLERLQYGVFQLPSLESYFFLFQNGGIFQNYRLRQAVSLAMNPEFFINLVHGYGISATQFSHRGIFGFDPRIPERIYDLSESKKLVQLVSGFERIPVRIGVLKDFESFGLLVSQQLKEAGFDPTLAVFSSEEFFDRISETDLFFFGWKFEFPNTLDFLKNVVHSGGSRNFNDYMNSDVDDLIDDALETFDQKKRLATIQKIMNILVSEDMVGIPLLEPQNLSVSAPDITFFPRLDGQLLLREIQ